MLDYLLTWFLDKPAFDAAVQAAMPSADGRHKVEKELKQAEKDLERTQREIKNLVHGRGWRADVTMLLDAQGESRLA